MGNAHDKLPGSKKSNSKKHKDEPIKIDFPEDAVIGTAELDSLWSTVGGPDAQQIATSDALRFAQALVTQIHVIDPALEIGAWQKENANPTSITKLQFYGLFLQLNSKASFPLVLTDQMKELQVNFFGETLPQTEVDGAVGGARPVYPICLAAELRKIPFGAPDDEPFNNKVVSAIHTRQKDHAPGSGYTISTLAILKEDFASSQWRCNTLVATYTTSVHEQSYTCFLGRRPHRGENNWMAVFCYPSNKGTHFVALQAAGYTNWVETGTPRDSPAPLSPKSEGASEVSSGDTLSYTDMPMWRDAVDGTASASDSLFESNPNLAPSTGEKPFPTPGITFNAEPQRTESSSRGGSLRGSFGDSALTHRSASGDFASHKQVSTGGAYLSSAKIEKIRNEGMLGRSDSGALRTDGLRGSDGTPSCDESSLEGSRGGGVKGDKSPKKIRKRLNVQEKKDSKTKIKKSGSSSPDDPNKRSRDESRPFDPPPPGTPSKADNLLGIATNKLLAAGDLGSKKHAAALDFASRSLKSVQKKYPHAHFIQTEATKKIDQEFLEIDKQRSKNFDCLKIGILYTTPETDVIEKMMSKKNVPSERFDQFLEALNIGESKEGMSEVTYHNIKIGWMVGPKMDGKDAIRSYIGNSPCIILFHDSPEPFDPSKLFLGQVTNFVCVVSPTATPNQWKVGFFVHYEYKMSQKEGVPDRDIKHQEELVLKHLCDFEPKIPIDTVFHKEEILEFLVAKMFNSKFNFMRYHPVVKRMFEAPIAASLQTIVSTYQPDWYKDQITKKVKS